MIAEPRLSNEEEADCIIYGSCNPTSEYAQFWTELIEKDKEKIVHTAISEKFTIEIFEDLGKLNRKQIDRKEMRKKFKLSLENTGIDREQIKTMIEKYFEEYVPCQMRVDKIDPKQIKVYNLEEDAFASFEEIEKKNKISGETSFKIDDKSFEQMRQLYIQRLVQEELDDHELKREKERKQLSSSKPKVKPTPKRRVQFKESLDMFDDLDSSSDSSTTTVKKKNRSRDPTEEKYDGDKNPATNITNSLMNIEDLTEIEEVDFVPNAKPELKDQRKSFTKAAKVDSPPRTEKKAPIKNQNFIEIDPEEELPKLHNDRALSKLFEKKPEQNYIKLEDYPSSDEAKPNKNNKKNHSSKSRGNKESPTSKSYPHSQTPIQSSHPSKPEKTELKSRNPTPFKQVATPAKSEPKSRFNPRDPRINGAAAEKLGMSKDQILEEHNKENSHNPHFVIDRKPSQQAYHTSSHPGNDYSVSFVLEYENQPIKKANENLGKEVKKIEGAKGLRPIFQPQEEVPKEEMYTRNKISKPKDRERFRSKSAARGESPERARDSPPKGSVSHQREIVNYGEVLSEGEIPAPSRKKERDERDSNREKNDSRSDQREYDKRDSYRRDDDKRDYNGQDESRKGYEKRENCKKDNEFERREYGQRENDRGEGIRKEQDRRARRDYDDRDYQDWDRAPNRCERDRNAYDRYGEESKNENAGFRNGYRNDHYENRNNYGQSNAYNRNSNSYNNRDRNDHKHDYNQHNPQYRPHPSHYPAPPDPFVKPPNQNNMSFQNNFQNHNNPLVALNMMFPGLFTNPQAISLMASFMNQYASAFHMGGDQGYQNSLNYMKVNHLNNFFNVPPNNSNPANQCSPIFGSPDNPKRENSEKTPHPSPPNEKRLNNPPPVNGNQPNFGYGMPQLINNQYQQPNFPPYQYSQPPPPSIQNGPYPNQNNGNPITDRFSPPGPQRSNTNFDNFNYGNSYRNGYKNQFNHYQDNDPGNYQRGRLSNYHQGNSYRDYSFDRFRDAEVNKKRGPEIDLSIADFEEQDPNVRHGQMHKKVH